MNKKTYTENVIILRRINYGEADRIITFLGSESGQISAIAKGVRKPKSKLAGGLELFSVSTITFMATRGGLDLVRSTRLVRHYGHIISDYGRMSLAYDVIKVTNTLTADMNEPAFFKLLENALSSLDDLSIPIGTIECWFYLHVATVLGQQPNLSEDSNGNKLDQDCLYNFDITDGVFVEHVAGEYSADHIKVWRLLSSTSPNIAMSVHGIDEFAVASSVTIRQFVQQAAGLN